MYPVVPYHLGEGTQRERCVFRRPSSSGGGHASSRRGHAEPLGALKPLVHVHVAPPYALPAPVGTEARVHRAELVLVLLLLPERDREAAVVAALRGPREDLSLRPVKRFHDAVAPSLDGVRSRIELVLLVHQLQVVVGEADRQQLRARQKRFRGLHLRRLRGHDERRLPAPGPHVEQVHAVVAEELQNDFVVPVGGGRAQRGLAVRIGFVDAKPCQVDERLHLRPLPAASHLAQQHHVAPLGGPRDDVVPRLRRRNRG
mmetsp:Transcript_42491/g.85926  ORF Transcript_42491/g.85926 Transcript_42491/m.85926 type:complete len:258 (-) Transcript_42491:381-1154(-)